VALNRFVRTVRKPSFCWNIFSIIILVPLMLVEISTSAFSQSTPVALKSAKHNASLSFLLRDGTRVFGKVLRVDAASISVAASNQPPTIIARADLLQVQQGDALLYSAISSWRDVEAAHVISHEAFFLKMQNGKVVKGRPVKVTADAITLKHGFITTKYLKADIATVDYLRMKPETDTWDNFSQEAPFLLFFLPETYYRLMGLEGRIPVRLYDSSQAESVSPSPNQNY